MRLYKQWAELVFFVRHRLFGKLPRPQDSQVILQTKHPIAYESPDHLIPRGTKADNSTNKKFVMRMSALIQSQMPAVLHGMLDLGCSGGQLVRDFRDLGWLAVGLEGSDYSLKHRRANWPALAGRNLFTCDITKPFRLSKNRNPARFHLVTCWEVLEHIPEKDLPQLFKNILEHMATGAYFVASTTSVPDIQNGIDLHQTHWTNQRWRQWIARSCPELQPVELGLKFFQYVRHNEERSFLAYRKQ